MKIKTEQTALTFISIFTLRLKLHINKI